MEIIVCKYYQLARLTGNKFSKEHKTLIRSSAKITTEHFERVNANWKDGGRIYEKDEEATVEMLKQGKAQQEAREEAEMLRIEGTKQLSDAITAIAKNPVGRPKKNI